MTLEELKEKVENYYKVDLRSTSRIRSVINAKRMFLYYAREIHGEQYSFQFLSNYVGLRNHATAYHHVNTVKDWIEQNDKIIINDFWKALGISLRKDFYPQEIEEETIDKINYYINLIPKDKLQETLERVRSMAKCYNVIHGKDKYEIIKGHDGVSNSVW